jgi:hypothetical protein
MCFPLPLYDRRRFYVTVTVIISTDGDGTLWGGLRLTVRDPTNQ